jgi:hypothetical protein
MLNALSQSTIKPLHSYLSPHLLSTISAHPCYKQCCSERGSCYMKMTWRCCGVLGVHNPSRLPVMFGVFVSRIKHKSLIIFLFLTWYCFCYSLMSTICMKIDPGMHIGLHLAFFGKTGVTASTGTPAEMRKSLQDRWWACRSFGSWRPHHPHWLQRSCWAVSWNRPG